jgi:hypothetical protein
LSFPNPFNLLFPIFQTFFHNPLKPINFLQHLINRDLINTCTVLHIPINRKIFYLFYLCQLMLQLNQITIYGGDFILEIITEIDSSRIGRNVTVNGFIEIEYALRHHISLFFDYR